MIRQTLIIAQMLLAIAGAQAQTPFTVTVEEIEFADAPAVQSFVHAQHDGKWLLLGGRTDGLHQRQPFASFLVEGNNTMVYVMDIEAGTVASANLDGLPPSVYEALQSTNQEFEQRGNTLYTMGGYGYSAEALDHVTFPYLTAIDVPALIAAVEWEKPELRSHLTFARSRMSSSPSPAATSVCSMTCFIRPADNTSKDATIRWVRITVPDSHNSTRKPSAASRLKTMVKT